MNDRTDLARALGSEDEILGETPEPTPADLNPGEGAGPGADPDKSPAPGPLDGLTFDQIRADPVLGKELQSQIDKTVAAQLRGKTAQVRTELLPQLRQQVEDEILTKYFGDMDDESKAQVLAADPKLAATYGRLQLQQQSAPSTQDDLERQATVHGLARHIHSVHARLINSDLPDSVKASLDPNVFLADKSGEQAVEDWTAAIDQAVVTDMLTKSQKDLMSTEFEAFKEERLAQEDSSRPNALLQPGTRVSPLPDLMTTDSSMLLEQAFASNSGRKK